MADMDVRVRLTGDGAQLVQQLNAVAGAEKSVAAGADDIKRSASGAATATAQMETASKRQAAALGQMTQGAQRFNSANLGAQVQDITQSLALGINPMVVFGQQAGQTAAAVAQMGGTAGKIGTFLAGPWGSLILAGVTVVGLFTTSLLQNKEAADLAKLGSDGLSDAQSVLAKIFDTTSGAIKNQNALLLTNARLQAVNLRTEALAAKAKAKTAFDNAGELGFDIRRGGALYGRTVEEDVKRARVLAKVANAVRAGKLPADQAVGLLENFDFKGLKVDREEFNSALVASVEAKAKEETARLIDQSLSSGKLAQEFINAPKARKAGKVKSGAAAARAAEALGEFGSDTGDRIASILAPFDEAPAAIDRTSAAMRQLDDIIDDIQRKRPANAAELIAKAQAAKEQIESGRVRRAYEAESAELDRAARKALGSASEQFREAVEKPLADIGQITQDILDNANLRAEVKVQMEEKALDALAALFGNRVAGLLNTARNAGGTNGATGGFLENVGKGKLAAERAFADLLAKSLDKVFGKLSKALGETLGAVIQGAEVGGEIAGIGKSLGVKTSKLGGQIGGAIGSAVAGPLGAIVGGALGSIVGGLFKKTPKGNVAITQSGSTFSGSGKLREGLTGAGDAVSNALGSIADQLGGDVGTFSANIRQKGKKVYANGVRVTDLEAAANKVIADALAAGAVTGLSAAVTRAIRSSTDVDKALEEALATKSLETALGGFAGAAKAAFDDFNRLAKERLRIANAYGLELNRVEELNAKERVKLRDQLERESFGSLQELLDRLRGGDLFEGSAVDQRNILLADIEKATAAAKAGEEGAADKLAGLLEQLNQTSRNVFGTTGGFAADRSGIQATAEAVIANLRGQLDAATGDSAATQAIETGNALLDENNSQNAQILAELQRLGILNAGGTLTPAQMNIAQLAYTGGQGAGISGGAVLESLLGKVRNL